MLPSSSKFSSEPADFRASSARTQYYNRFNGKNVTQGKYNMSIQNGNLKELEET